MNKVYSSGLEYRSLAENTLSLCGIGSCTDENITVPEFVDGNRVISVDSFAFRRNESLKSISLPDSVDYIGAEAFAWCRNLCSISFNGVIHISERAFMGCDSLVSAHVGEKLNIMGKKAFAYCPSLESIILPDSLETLGASAFDGCRNLRAVVLPNSLKSLENGTFYACCNLNSINIPENLGYVDEFAFAYCISLENLAIPARTIINQYAFFETKEARLVS